MALLKFYAREDLLVRAPGLAFTNQPAAYIGRTFDAPNRAFPATREPFETDSDTDVGRRLVKLVRREQSLFPADAATASACGVSFEAVTFRDGAWTKAAEQPKGAKGAAKELTNA